MFRISRFPDETATREDWRTRPLWRRDPARLSSGALKSWNPARKILAIRLESTSRPWLWLTPPLTTSSRPSATPVTKYVSTEYVRTTTTYVHILFRLLNTFFQGCTYSFFWNSRILPDELPCRISICQYGFRRIVSHNFRATIFFPVYLIH